MILTYPPYLTPSKNGANSLIKDDSLNKGLFIKTVSPIRHC